MTTFYDIYVLCDRTRANIAAFKAAYLEDAEPCQTEYEYPHLAHDSEFVTDSAEVIIETVLKDIAQKYSLYWRPRVERDGEPCMMMLFFTNDNYLIAGLTVPENRQSVFMNQLMTIMQSERAGITFESPPPLNSQEFIQLFCRNQRDDE